MVAIGSGKITVLYNKYYNDEFIRYTIPHEYHHSVLTENRPKTEGTVLDHMVFEGKAVMFEKLVNPEMDLRKIDFNSKDFYWSKIVGDLEKRDLNRASEINLGGNGLPYEYGYSEGYKMVKSYLDLHPDVSIEEWTALSPKEILRKETISKTINKQVSNRPSIKRGLLLRLGIDEWLKLLVNASLHERWCVGVLVQWSAYPCQ